jgi:hypothetical protein
MIEPQRSRTSGARARRSRSGQRRYTVIGFSAHMSSPAVKSDPESDLMTVSVRRGRIRVSRVPHAESRNRSERLASGKATLRNCVASSGLMASSLEAAATSPSRIIDRT